MKYKIMGAGPAGLSAAIKLAQSGYDVDVFEETSTIGGHTGNNIQAIRGYSNDKNILKKFEKEEIKLKHLHPIYKIVKYTPSHKFDIIYSDSKPLFYTTKRGIEYDSLDNQLAEQAKKEGANILLGKKAKLVDVNIVAGGSKFDPVGMGYGGLFEGNNFDNNTILFFFGSKYFPHGYAYAIPYKKKQLTIAITSFIKLDFPTMAKKFGEFIKKDKIVSKTIENSELLNNFAGYGHFNIPNSAIHNHKYFIGGAAGFVDPARGFGLKYAILSGIFAAKAITSKADYDKLWQKEFKQELIDGFNRRMILNKLKLEEYEQFVENKKIPINIYTKIPNSIKQMVINLNGSIKLKQWKTKFKFEKLFTKL